MSPSPSSPSQRSLPLSSFQWILHGNFVVPTGHPFEDGVGDQKNDNVHEEHDVHDDLKKGSSKLSPSSSSCLSLGPGLNLKVDHILAVDLRGIIACVEAASIFWDKYCKDDDVDSIAINDHPGYLRLSQTDEFVCPGLIDLHIHAPQYAFCGTGTDRPLMGPDGWLETYTFPTEASLRDLDKAQRIYDRVVRKTLSLGTTTAVYFATLDVEPTKVLVDQALLHGQRALIGKVSMDRHSPAFYCQSIKENLKGTQQVISYIRNHPSPRQQADVGDNGSLTVSPLVLPLVTPRFIPTCSPALLEGLGRIAKREQCHITSHISESIDEVAFSRSLAQNDYFQQTALSTTRDDFTDAQIFDNKGLLGDKCIMAHGVFLSEDDLDLMKQRGSAVAHCPLSNFFFAGASLGCKELMRRGNKVGLGTDVAGGCHPSMMESARSAVVASLSLQHQQHAEQARRLPGSAPQQTQAKPNRTLPQRCGGGTDGDDNPTLDYRHAFYLATLGGARALSLEDKIGSLQVGMEFDAIILSAVGARAGTGDTSSTPTSSWPDLFPDDTLSDRFQKLWMLGDDRNIRKVFVQGKLVKTIN